jgi:hypothetical protein
VIIMGSKEKWVPVNDCLGILVSDEGYVRYSDGKYINQRVGTHGYKVVTLSKCRTVNKKVRIGLVHRLVAMHHIENSDPSTKVFVNHINGDKLDNRACNLEWVTADENMRSFWTGDKSEKPSDMISQASLF